MSSYTSEEDSNLGVSGDWGNNFEDEKTGALGAEDNLSEGDESGEDKAVLEEDDGLDELREAEQELEATREEDDDFWSSVDLGDELNGE